jgi:ubiquinone/menaquinone biosynthesis C-methylase UbiE
MRKSRQGRRGRTHGSFRVRARARKYFAAVASRWDRMREDFFDETVADSILKASDVKPGNTVVDVGCGTGFLTRQAVMQIQGKGRVVGVDLSPSMLEKAEDNLSKLALHGSVEFRVGDAENIPVQDDFADAVVGNMILHHCAKPKQAVLEMTRILKEGGRVAVADLEKHNERWLREEMADRWLGFDLAKVKKWFQDAGLESVKVELARTKCCGISLHGRKAEIGIFVASGSKPKPMARL